MVALGAAAKGRSSARPLLRLCRQMVPNVLVLNIRPAELNPADGPSRGTAARAAHADRLGPALRAAHG